MAEKPPLVMLPEFCPKHQRTVVRRLDIPESGPWQMALHTVSLLMFQVLSGEEQIAAQAHYKGDELPRVFKELGCLACYRYPLFAKAIQLVRKRGLKTAFAIATGKVKDERWHS